MTRQQFQVPEQYNHCTPLFAKSYGQRDRVPAQHGFCRLAIFSGNKGFPVKSFLARRPDCCSDNIYAVHALWS
jgi:hypothetical protein